MTAVQIPEKTDTSLSKAFSLIDVCNQAEYRNRNGQILIPFMYVHKSGHTAVKTEVIVARLSI